MGKRLTIAMVVLVALPLLYPLSIGPAFWLANKHYLHRDHYDRFYGPLEEYAYESGPPLQWALNFYLNLCNLVPDPLANRDRW